MTDLFFFASEDEFGLLKTFNSFTLAKILDKEVLKRPNRIWDKRKKIWINSLSVPNRALDTGNAFSKETDRQLSAAPFSSDEEGEEKQKKQKKTKGKTKEKQKQK